MDLEFSLHWWSQLLGSMVISQKCIAKLAVSNFCRIAMALKVESLGSFFCLGCF